MAKVLYKLGTKEIYLGLSARDPNSLYWCQDSRELYKGDDLYTGGVRIIATMKQLPPFKQAADSILYLCSDTGNGFVLSPSRDKWLMTVHGVDGRTLGYTPQGLLEVRAVPIGLVTGLEERLHKVETTIVSGAPIATSEVPGLVAPNSTEFVISDRGAMTLNAIPQHKIIGLETRLQSIEATQVGGVHYRGSVPTSEQLPTDAKQGDLYEVRSDNSEWCFNGTEWFEYGNGTDTGELKPIAKAELNTKEFEISDGILNLKQVDAGKIMLGDQPLDTVVSKLAASMTWGDLA